MTDALTAKACVPCQGGIPPLTEDEAGDFLSQTPGWELQDGAHHLHRRFEFDDFQASLEFVDKVGAIADDEEQHPDIEFGWRYARITIYTHKINGLHEYDYNLAAKINAV